MAIMHTKIPMGIIRQKHVPIVMEQEEVIDNVGGLEMALITCPECNAEVSDKATSCPKCGFPIQQAIQQAQQERLKEAQQERMAACAHFSFEHTGQVFNTGCKIMDMNGYELASCNMGQSVSFQCDKPMTVRVKMGGCFGKPTVDIVPGGIYEAGTSGLGAVRVQKTGQYHSSKK